MGTQAVVKTGGEELPGIGGTAVTLTRCLHLYLELECGPPESSTFQAKRRDLQKFLEYFVHAMGADRPDLWTRSVSLGFRKHMEEELGLVATTVNRARATLRHAARWVHKRRAFLAGSPMEAVEDLLADDPEWKGLSALGVNRLFSFAAARPGQDPSSADEFFEGFLARHPQDHR